MRSKLPYIILIVIFAGYVALEVLGPQPENWTASYTLDKEDPFASYLLYESLPDLFPGHTVTVVEDSPKDVLKEFENEKSNYIIIDEEIDTDQREARALMDYVKRGNNVFLAASVFSGSLADSLDIENQAILWDLLEKEVARKDYLYFEESIDPDKKHYPLLDNVVYNRIPYGHKGEVLSENKKGHPMFIRLEHGDGNFYIHSVPLMFTNYFMVDPVNHQYISRALSFLPNENVIWDEHFKPGKIRTDSPVKYVLEERSLAWAWFVLLGAVALFVAFESKRRQRIIPLIEPPANTTLEFTETVGRLYHSHGDHKDIAEKKIKFLLEYVRNRWMIPTSSFTSEFKEKLSTKSGTHRQDIETLFQVIAAVHAADTIDEGTLRNLNQQIDRFYSQSK